MNIENQEKSPSIQVEILEKEKEKNINWTQLQSHTFNEDAFYRIISTEGYLDYLNNDVVRSSPTGTKTKLTEGGLNLGNRPTSFPSFAKGKPDINFLEKEGDSYILESEVNMYKRGDTNPTTQNTITGRHWAYRAIDTETGQSLKVLTPDMIKNIYRLSDGGHLYIQDKKDIIL